MSNEITTSGSIELVNGNITIKRSLSNVRFDQTTAEYHAGVQEIGTSEEVLILGDVSGTTCWMFARNLDDTNFIRIGLTGSYFIHLLPGEWFIGRVASIPYAISDTLACNLEYVVFEL